MSDKRKLEKTSVPGIYRRHAGGCKGNGRCKCPYVVRWKERGQEHKQMFATFELAREFKANLGSGKGNRRPQSSLTVATYYETWFPAYRGRTSRDLRSPRAGSTRSAFGCTSSRCRSPVFGCANWRPPTCAIGCASLSVEARHQARSVAPRPDCRSCSLRPSKMVTLAPTRRLASGTCRRIQRSDSTESRPRAH